MSICIDCGKELKSANSQRCQTCHNRHIWAVKPKKPKNCCIDCNIEISSHAKRCRHCDRLQQWKDPEFRTNITNRSKIRMTAQWKDPSGIMYVNAAKSFTRMWANDATRKVMLERLRLRDIKNWSDPAYRLHMCAKFKERWADPSSNARNAFRYSKLKPSSLELKFMLMLDVTELVYVYQYKPPNYRHKYDFFLSDLNILIELDGNFWHSSDWAVKHNKPEQDNIKTKWAIDNGYTLIRLSEDDVFNEDFIDKFIMSLLAERSPA